MQVKKGLKFQHKFWLDIHGKPLKAEITKIEGEKIYFAQLLSSGEYGMEFHVPKYEFIAKHYGKRLKKSN